MRVRRDEKVAIRIGPEPCAVIREGDGEVSVEIVQASLRGADAVSFVEGNTDHAIASVRLTPRGLRPWHVRKLLAREPGDRAATLAVIPAGESPAGGNCPVDTVVISGGGTGDRT